MDESPKPPGERRKPELPKYCEWKSWYRGKAWAWLRENKDYWFANVDSHLDNLGGNLGYREAAVALFWTVYLNGEQPLQLTEKQVRQIEAMLGRVPSGGKDQLDGQAFVKLQLAGTLAVSLIGPDVDLGKCPTALKAFGVADHLGDTSFLNEFYKGIGEAQNDPYWGRDQLDSDLFRLSVVLVYGIIALELALWQTKQGKYEEALGAMAVAVYFLYPTQFHSSDTRYDDNTGKQATFMPWVDRTFTYLPHSRGDFDAQDAALVFEEIRAHVDTVRDWGAVQQACKQIGQAGFIDDVVLTDRDGTDWEGRVYWEKAATFADCQKRTQRQARENLQDNFLRDVYDELVAEVGQHLLNAETSWLRAGEESADSSQYQSQIRSMLEEYHSALAELLVYVCPSLNTEMDANKDDKDNKGPKQPLTRMKKRLEYERRASQGLAEITGHLQREDQNFMWWSLTHCLQRMIDARSYFVHGGKHKHVTTEKKNEAAKVVRYELLGIEGRESVIKRLVKVKRGCGAQMQRG
ncbi:MAG: hypothetical protein NTZ04_05560 [Chloroflexi bacterium]|nr:hypothetical protein [Chloroflexota bacterium]